MKATWPLLLCILITSSVLANPQPIETINTATTNKMTITKTWHLNPWHDFIYLISNPIHTEMRLVIDISPKTKDHLGFPVDSAPIKLTCGDQIFYITSFDSGGITVCKTTDDIRLDLISLEGNPSEGKYTLDIK